MAERMMKELFVEGLQKGKWQYFKEVLKFAIAKMATTEIIQQKLWIFGLKIMILMNVMKIFVT